MSKKIKKFNKKRFTAAAISITALITLSITAYAWFTYQRRIETITKIAAPTSLAIGAGAKEDSANIDMGGIDVTNTAQKKDFVFCVYSDTDVGEYKIQLAHTTNIDFTYTIYKSTESETAPANGDFVVYVDETDNNHYYQKGDAVAGKFLNIDDSKIANSSLHDKSYGEYNSVQKNAEPLYWQNTDPIQPTVGANDTSFVDYYILEVSWNSATIQNDKETDIVYLTAGMV